MGLLDCLAIVIFLEARGEPLQGQIAVGQVVMNRVVSSKYPNSICAVVEQPDQFAFNLSKTPSTAAYFVALSLPHYKDLVYGATHFYSGNAPFWAQGMEMTLSIGGHKFFREKK